MAKKTKQTPKTVVKLVVKYVYSYTEEGTRYFRWVCGCGKYSKAFPESQLNATIKKSPLITFRRVTF